MDALKRAGQRPRDRLLGGRPVERRRGEPRQRFQSLRGVRGDSFQQPAIVVEQALDGGGLEPAPIVAEAEREPRTRPDAEGQRVVGPLDRAHLLDGDAAVLLTQRGIHRVVLEDEDALEERLARRHFAPRSHLGERAVLVLPELRLLRLHPLQPGDELRLRIDAHPDRQSVDAEPDQIFDAGQRRRSPRDRSPEDDILRTAGLVKHQRPCAEGDGVERQLLPAREHAKIPRDRRAEPDLSFVTARGGGRRSSPPGDPERRRRAEAFEPAPPELAGLRRVLPPEPGEILGEGACRLELRSLAETQRFIAGEDFFEEDRQRPAVQHQVVMAQDETMRIRRDATERETQQGRAGRIEPARPILQEQSLQERFLLLAGELPPIVRRDRHLHPSSHDLQRTAGSLPGHVDAQAVVTIHHMLPCGLEGRTIEISPQGAGELLDVLAGAGRKQGVKQHPLLHRRERVDILDRPVPGQEPIQLALVEIRQGKVRRSGPARLGGPAMRDEPPQLRQIPVGQAFDRGSMVARLAVDEAQPQPVSGDQAVDLDQVAAPAAGPVRGAGVPSREAEERFVRQRRVELSQIVERHLRLRHRPQPRGHLRISAEIAQQPVADSVPRHTAELFFDRPERLARGARLSQAQHDGSEAREPAHGARQIHTLEEILPAMALEIDPQRSRACPGCERLREGGQEDVIDLRAVSPWNFLKKRPRLRRLQHHGNRARRFLQILPCGLIERQAARRTASFIEPVGEVASRLLAPRVLRQPVRPGAEGGRLGRKPHRFAPCQLPAGRFQVFQQNAPGDAIHRQMVNHDQKKTRPRLAPIEKADAEQRPFRQIEAGLEPLRRDGDGLEPTRLRLPGEIVEQDLRRRFRTCDGLPPALGGPREPQPQRIVVPVQMPQRFREESRRERLPHFEKEGLVPVVRVGEILFEEPALDRCERRPADHEPLLRRRGRGALRHRREACDRLVLEHLLGREPDPGLMRPRHHLKAQDGVAARLEEIVVDPDPLDPQQAGPDAGQGPFNRRARGGGFARDILINACFFGPRFRRLAHRRAGSLRLPTRSDSRRSGSAMALSSRETKCSARRAMVAASKRSALYSSVPLRPSAVSANARVRSYLAVPVPTGRSPTVNPGISNVGGGTLSRASITWNSGVWLSCLFGRSVSTRRSKGRS